MKKILIIFLFLSFINSINAQQQSKDSLIRIIDQDRNDIAEVNALINLAIQQTQFDSAVIYAQQGLSLAKKINYIKGEGDCLWILGSSNGKLKNFSLAIQYGLEALKIYTGLKDDVGMVESCMILQGPYREAGDYRKALIYAFAGLQISEAKKVKGKYSFAGSHLAPLLLAEIGGTYVLMDKLDSALFYTQKSIDQKEMFNGSEWNFPIYLLATYQTIRGDYMPALRNYRKAKTLAPQNGFPWDTLQIMSGMSNLFIRIGEPDSALLYGETVVRAWTFESEIKNLIESNNSIAQAYKLKGNTSNALKYIEITHALKDSIFSKEKDRELQQIAFTEDLKQKELITAQTKYKNRIKLYSLSAGLFILLLLAAILWRNNRQKQKARNKIEKAYNELKTTQSQLIQSEKMASLGELTAGIAHEIQNPLNFVNNFSEVNSEFVDELQHEADKGNLDEVKAIAKDIKENEKKINHHGKRADTIVKNMLQHSRASSGKKEPTDINALAEEYLRLSYHGLRAKNKSFNATTKTDFDNSIGKINIIPQDVGRVILNLINNAFYAVSEKQKQNINGYEPTVIVSTHKHNGKVEIKVTDNGNGIPQKVLDKIFQPFFTTKPTGQGTGLGLSLSYDIVKAHSGELKVETKEGEGSVFVIILPTTFYN